MTVATENRDTKSMLAPIRSWPAKFTVLNDAVLFAGCMLAIDSTPEAQMAADTAGLKVVGRCPVGLDNAADGLESNADLGIFLYANDTGTAVVAADKVCYVEDNQTVTGFAGSTNKVVAGLVVAVTTDGVWVDQTFEGLRTAAALAAGLDTSIIVVGKGGSDTTGDGSFANPYLTMTKALTVCTTARKTIYMLAGEYAEAATITWPNVTGISVIGLGPVSISNANAAAQVILVNPTFTASTFEVTLTNINIAADTQIGIKVDNENMTKKLNLYLDGVTTEMDTSGDSIDVAGTTTSQAVRMYIDNCSFEGLVHFTASNAASRLRCATSKFTGGITTAGAVAAELSLRACEILTGALTIGSANWNLTYRGSLYATDADPAVYTELADGYSA